MDRFHLPRIFLILLLSGTAQAIDPLSFQDSQQEVRFQNLTRELRCLVCQNENLADSNADLAKDLRKEIYTLMQNGKSDDEIKSYLTARYSDFVLYDPPLKLGTLLLWFGPAVVFLLGAVVIYTYLRRRRRADSPVITDQEDW